MDTLRSTNPTFHANEPKLHGRNAVPDKRQKDGYMRFGLATGWGNVRPDRWAEARLWSAAACCRFSGFAGPACWPRGPADSVNRGASKLAEGKRQQAAALQSACGALHPPSRKSPHSRESGNPVRIVTWTPAFERVTIMGISFLWVGPRPMPARMSYHPVPPLKDRMGRPFNIIGRRGVAGRRRWRTCSCLGGRRQLSRT